MQLPFTLEQFLGVFAAYNRAIEPAQFVAYGLGLAAVALVFSRRAGAGRAIAAILAVLWFWTGAVYHLLYFARIDWVAYWFGALFIVQGLLLIYSGVARRTLHFRFKADSRGILGVVLIVYAMVVYPMLNVWFGHAYPYMPVFGVTPCPTTIFTFGLLLFVDRSPGRGVPGHLLLIPFVWSLVGASAAVSLGMVEDYGLLAAGLLTLGLIAATRRAGAPRQA